MNKSITIYVSGKVQGVFFRASAKEEADSLGLCGTVKNMDDGRVCIEVEGEPSLLEMMIYWCKIGPRMARVENVEVRDNELRGFESFDIIT